MPNWPIDAKTHRIGISVGSHPSVSCWQSAALRIRRLVDPDHDLVHYFDFGGHDDVVG